MEDKSLHILAEPIITVFGSIRYLTMREYIRLKSELSIISMDILHFFYYYNKVSPLIEDENQRQEINKKIRGIRNLTLYEYILSEESLKNSYKRIFDKVIEYEKDINSDTIFLDERLFLELRKLILEMNYIKEDEVSPNPEIQNYYEQLREKSARENGDISIADLISSVFIGSKRSYNEIFDMSVIQFYSAYYRIGKFKNYDTSTLFATVSSEGKIESWTANIDLFKKEQLGTKYSEFEGRYKGVLSMD